MLSNGLLATIYMSCPWRLGTSKLAPVSAHLRGTDASLICTLKSQVLRSGRAARSFRRHSSCARLPQLQRRSKTSYSHQARQYARWHPLHGMRRHKASMAASVNIVTQASPQQPFQYPDLSNSSFAPELNLKGAPFYSSSKAPALKKEADTKNDARMTANDPGVMEDDFPDDAEVEAELEEATITSLGDVEEAIHAPFYSPQGFHIPSEKMKIALEAPAGSEASHWHYTLYRGFSADPEVKIHYCSTKDQMEKVLHDHFKNEKIVGLDLEWQPRHWTRGKPTIQQCVSLIQIASEERIGLFHIARFVGNKAEDFVSPTLKALAESPDVLKCGVAISGDCTRLRKHLGLDCQGQFELTHLYKLIKFHRGEEIEMNKRLVSLKNLVQAVFGLPLLKDDVRVSDWSSTKPLSKEQCKYAASDAYASLQIFYHLDAARLKLKDLPPRPANAELRMPLLEKPIRKIISQNTESSFSTEESFESIPSHSFDSDEDFGDVSSALADVDFDVAEFSEAPDSNPSSQQEPSAAPVSPRPPITSTRSNNTSPATSITSPEFDLATKWAQQYIADNGRKAGTTPANLRTYHLWHHQNMEIQNIAALLRDPPLKDRTVTGYICEAVYRGNLPAPPGRFAASIGESEDEPVRPSHKRMLQRAIDEKERREARGWEEIGDAANVGWWNNHA